MFITTQFDESTHYEKIRKYALDFAYDACGVTDEVIKESTLELHSKLESFPDANDALVSLKKKIETAVLSNGAPRSLFAYFCINTRETKSAASPDYFY